MCGITALVRDDDADVDASAVSMMAKLVAHRGPDAAGQTVFAASDGGFSPVREDAANWRVALGHRRLSILDLSEGAVQPMRYRDDLWLLHNGEIYNYLELRAELERLGHAFRTRSDTEVVLAAYDEWGTDCFSRLRGMWATVLFDARRRRLVLSRDRFGMKPLFVTKVAGVTAIFSEPKQATAVPNIRLQADDRTVVRYLLTGYDDGQQSFFVGISALPSGSWQALDVDSGRLSPAEPYWFPERIAPAVSDRDEAALLFRNRLDEACRLHLRSDVFVGCALSGGLDSSAIAAGVRSVGGDGARITAFTATFPGFEFDERPYADAVAQHVAADSRYVTPSPERFLDDLDDFIWANDEPVGSLNQYAAYAVARLTSEAGVKVILNGQGGDEILSAYWQSYFVSLSKLLGRRPGAAIGEIARAAFPGGNTEALRQIPVMAARYKSRRNPWRDLPLRAPHADDVVVSGPATDVGDLDFRAWRIYEITKLTLPRLLKWDDRNFMAFSVESRCPMLDHELVETCLSFWPSALYARGWTKEPLRRGYADMLPTTITRRKTKVNFATPQDAWLCGPLRPAVQRFMESDSPVWRYVEPSTARDLAGRVWATQGRRPEPGQALLRLIFLDRWMKLFGLD